MSLASRAGDLYYSFRFVKLLTTPWVESDAYKLGLIDENGKRDKSVKIDNDDKKTAYSTFVRLVFNIKRLLEKVPGGSSTLASYAAALFLLKEKYQLSDATVDKILKQCQIDPLDLMSESSQWYVLGDKQLSPGVYRLREDRVTCLDVEVNAKDTVRVSSESYPTGEIFGLDIYEVTHINTNQPVYITVGELYK
jgi:hypothetical protein